MAMPVITWQEMMEMEEGPDPVVDMFAEWIRIEDERDARMKMGVVEEKLSDEGSEVEMEGEEMDFEKAVETRVRKRCDLRMDEEEAMRKVKKIAWDVNSAMRDPRIDAKEMMQKENIHTEALRAFLNLDFVLGGSKRGTNPVKDALQEACGWMAEEIVKNSTRVMAEASGDGKVEKLLANKLGSNASAPAEPEQIDLSWQLSLQAVWEKLLHGDKGSNSTNSSETSLVFESLPLAIEWLRKSGRQDPSTTYQVLVTGSLHLVGDVLRLLKK